MAKKMVVTRTMGTWMDSLEDRYQWLLDSLPKEDRAIGTKASRLMRSIGRRMQALEETLQAAR